MRKKMVGLVLAVIISFAFATSGIDARANSAPPERPDTNSGIVFKQNESVRISSEVLDIDLSSNSAKITASYVMNNMTDKPLKIETMFLSPVKYNEERASAVTRNGVNLPVTTEYFCGELYNQSIPIERWESILSATRTRSKPFGEPTGFKCYSVQNLKYDMRDYSTAIEITIEPTDYYFTNMARNVKGSSVKYTVYESMFFVTRGELKISSSSKDYDFKVTDVEDIYNFIYEFGTVGSSADDGMPDFSAQQFNQYLADINLQKHMNGEPIELFYERRGEDFVSAITYFVDFAPNETLNLTVTYDSKLAINKNVASLMYYLTPARYWQSFADLTINLTLDEGRKFIKKSSLDFRQESDTKFVYISHELPTTELYLSVSNHAPISCNVNCYETTLLVLIVILPLLTIFTIVFGIRRNNKRKKATDDAGGKKV